MKNTTNPHQMDLTARVAFAKVYPAIARHITDKYNITQGHCLNAGSGPASLAIALAQITELNIVSLDKQCNMTDIARTNIAEAGLSGRITTVTSEVCHTPFDDNYFDLIVSRGSVFFWENQSDGLREMYRVLKPGGVIFCGGGMGSAAINREATKIIMTDDRFKDMRQFWQDRNCKRTEENNSSFKHALTEAGINGNILLECSGIWIEVIK